MTTPAPNPPGQVLCKGCLGRGTGRVCCICGNVIPEHLRRQPGDPSEIDGRVHLTRDELIAALVDLHNRVEDTLAGETGSRQSALESTERGLAALIEAATDGIAPDRQATQ